MEYQHRALGARIKAAMKAAGFKTAKAFTEQYGIPYLSFSQHLQGRRKPSKASLERYAEIFEVNVEWLETGEGNPLRNVKNVKQQATIETTLQHETAKHHSQVPLDPALLENILEEVIRLKSKYELTEKQCAHIVVNLYGQVTNATKEKALQLKMVSTFIKTYEATLQNI